MPYQLSLVLFGLITCCMNMKKILPILFFVVLAIVALALKRCNSNNETTTQSKPARTTRQAPVPATAPPQEAKLDRTATELFFTRHAKCRMKCRQISQQEVRDILLNGKVNYSKSELNDPKGATYALEGYTKDRQHVRVIFAPKQKHLSVVTVIDLEEEHPCSC